VGVEGISAGRDAADGNHQRADAEPDGRNQEEKQHTVSRVFEENWFIPSIGALPWLLECKRR